MIKNIVFDMGNTLIDFDRVYFLDCFGVEENDKELLMKEVYMSNEWAMMDAGTLDETDMFSIISKRIPERLNDKAYQLVFNWDKVIKPIQEVCDLVKQLKTRGYKIYLLSNASRRCLNEYFKTFEFSKYFDGEVVSAFVGHVKPERQIYEILVNKYDLKADECVFIDDLDANVESAIEFGMKAIVYRGNSEELKSKLEALLNKTA